MREEKRGYVDMPATPLYPFGYGLIYTQYEYSSLRIDPPQVRPEGRIRVSVAVKNTGDRAGTETVQHYNSRKGRSGCHARQATAGFERVDLKPGETKNVTLTTEDLQLLDRDLYWRVTPGDFEIMVGKSLEDLPLEGVLKAVP
jgi:hypothetical protein